MRPTYASKPDASRAAIVASIRKIGATWVDHVGRRGEPDGIWGFRGRMGWAELKVPGKEKGVCGCDSPDAEDCGDGGCECKGHKGTGNAERTTWHAQLDFDAAWSGPRVSVWTTPQEAIDTITKETT